MAIPIAILSIALILLLVILRSAARAASPLSRDEADRALAAALERVAKRRGLSAAGLTIARPRIGFRASYGADAEAGRRLFHAASVGKLFTAALIGRLIDEGKLAWDSRAAAILPPEALRGLFVWRGADRSGEVTIAMLLAHSSGVADYFGDQGRAGLSVGRLLAKEPHRLWSVDELLDFSRNEQRAVGAPGERYHYSDTGYLLLGLIAEAVRGAPFHELLRREIFEPSGMRDAYMPLREGPPAGAPPLRPAVLGGVDLSREHALSADWAGGGVALSATELVAFCEALNAGRIIRPETLSRMADFRHRFMIGVGYGYGLMELRPGEFSPFLKSWPRLRGHMGILGIQCFWDPEDGTVIVVSLGDDRAVADSVRLLLATMGIVKRLRA